MSDRGPGDSGQGRLPTLGGLVVGVRAGGVIGGIENLFDLRSRLSDHHLDALSEHSRKSLF